LAFLSQQTSHQQPANSIFLSEQISTNHQPTSQTNSVRLLAGGATTDFDAPLYDQASHQIKYSLTSCLNVYIFFNFQNAQETSPSEPTNQTAQKATISYGINPKAINSSSALPIPISLPPRVSRSQGKRGEEKNPATRSTVN
jgi:hypothetical protein